MDLTKLLGEIVSQKDSFLCAAKGTSINVEFVKRLGTGLVVKASSCNAFQEKVKPSYMQGVALPEEAHERNDSFRHWKYRGVHERHRLQYRNG